MEIEIEIGEGSGVGFRFRGQGKGIDDLQYFLILLLGNGFLLLLRDGSFGRTLN